MYFKDKKYSVAIKVQFAPASWPLFVCLFNFFYLSKINKQTKATKKLVQILKVAKIECQKQTRQV
jgi:hypothetical protein